MKRAERSDQQYFPLPWFSVLLASALIGTNDERSPRNSSSRDFNRNRESRRFRHVVRNVYTRSFDSAKLGKRVNSAPELFARTKPSCLPLPLFSNTIVWFFGCVFFLLVSCVSHVSCVYCDCKTFATPKSLYLCIAEWQPPFSHATG